MLLRGSLFPSTTPIHVTLPHSSVKIRRASPDPSLMVTMCSQRVKNVFLTLRRHLKHPIPAKVHHMMQFDDIWTKTKREGRSLSLLWFPSKCDMANLKSLDGNVEVTTKLPIANGGYEKSPYLEIDSSCYPVNGNFG